MADPTERLKSELLKLGRMVETAIYRAITSLQRRDKHLAEAVIQEDEQIDQAEVALEELCVSVLETAHVVGADLRFVVAVLKITDSLERIGDLAENIAATVIEVNNWEMFSRVKGCKELGQRAQQMLKMALDAFVQRDVKHACQVIEEDHLVDGLCKQMGEQIQYDLDNFSESAAPLLRLNFVTRQLERIGDLATNIAEDSIYMIEGRIIRHPSRFHGTPDVLFDGAGRFRRSNQ